jgi:hypothetical protein
MQTAARTYSTALEALTERQEKSVENGVPTAHVIALPGANHYVFLSNEAEVLEDIDAFLASLHSLHSSAKHDGPVRSSKNFIPILN